MHFMFSFWCFLIKNTKNQPCFLFVSGQTETRSIAVKVFKDLKPETTSSLRKQFEIEIRALTKYVCTLNFKSTHVLYLVFFFQSPA